MGRLFGTFIDLQKNELKQARFENSSAAPSSPVLGQQYFDTDETVMKFWDGTQWVSMGSTNLTAQLVWKDSVKVRTTQKFTSESFASSGVTYDNGTAGVGATLTQSDPLDGSFGSLDGIGVSVGDRVLVMSEATQSHNGIYELTEAGDGATTAWVLTRATDCDEANELSGSPAVFVNEGTTFANRSYVQTTDNVVVGTSSLVWAQFSRIQTAGAGLIYNEITNQLSIGDDNKGVQINTGSLEVDASEIAGNGLKPNDTNSWELDIDTASTVEADAQTLTTKVVTPASLANFTKMKTFDITGDGSTASFVINHAFGNQWVVVQLVSAKAPFGIFEANLERTDANNVTVSFDTAPPVLEDYKVLVVSN